MDVQRLTRERVFSILNDNNCPSFTFKQRQSTSAPHSQTLPPFSAITAGLSPRLDRPGLQRQPQFHRKSSLSSVGSPPLLRYDSGSSSKSSSSMDSSPSPVTPAYAYNEANIGQYDSILRPDLSSSSYLPASSGITPFMEQGIMIAPASDPFTSLGKPMPAMNPSAYPLLGASVQHELPQKPTPALSANVSVSSASSVPQPQQSANTGNNANQTGKKNKYPCPYATSHNCTATFTTSGHAARHGKKHTGEKGVHCPVCDKAFTRKDNMKQHERTHKNRDQNGKAEDKKSKAQLTREANKAKDAAKQADNDTQSSTQELPELQHPPRIRKCSSGQSEPSDVTLAPLVDTPTMHDGMFDTNPQIAIIPDSLDMALPSSSYPPLIDEVILPGGIAQDTKTNDMLMPQPPALMRGFSDLDTLAQAAESAFDPYFPQNSF